MKILLMTLMLFFAVACTDSDERYDRGYSDGYAEGYNTECKIRATLVDGDWENKDYKRGYDAGRFQGVAACRKKNQ